jgi:uncharacterized protein (TIGR00369 family)
MHTDQTQLKAIQAGVHPFCWVCSGSNPYGLALEFDVNDDGSVTASFTGNPAVEGFQGLLHGGMIASLLDGAMTNCLFAHGLVAVTAELKVRYRKPVVTGCEMVVRAWMEKPCPPLYLMRAELNQEGCVKATAVAEFMEHHE